MSDKTPRFEVGTGLRKPYQDTDYIYVKAGEDLKKNMVVEIDDDWIATPYEPPGLFDLAAFEAILKGAYGWAVHVKDTYEKYKDRVSDIGQYNAGYTDGVKRGYWYRDAPSESSMDFQRGFYVGREVRYQRKLAGRTHEEMKFQRAAIWGWVSAFIFLWMFLGCIES